jgi:hypothetical protein
MSQMLSLMLLAGGVAFSLVVVGGLLVVVTVASLRE